MLSYEIEKITIHVNISLNEKRTVSKNKIFPTKHYLIAKDVRNKAVKSMQE